MATEVEKFLDTKVGGFLAGVGIGTLLAVTVWVGGPFVIRAVLPRLGKIGAKKTAEFIVQDIIIGRVPLLNLERPIASVATIFGTITTVGFYLFGGMDTLKDFGKELVGFPIKGTGRPDEDSVTPVRQFTQAYRINSENQRLIMVALDGSRRDP